MPGLDQKPLSVDAAEQLYRSNLELIQSAIDFVARTMHLSEPDRDDFSSAAHVKLIDDDYRVFRKFQGGSTLKTYLVAVIKRFGIDFRNHRWGKWRPSVTAKRLGEAAVALETLLYRDQHPFSEAVSILTARGLGEATELEEIGTELPIRWQRRFDSDEGLEKRSGPAPTPLQQIRQSERARLHEKISEATREVAADLKDRDRLILRMNFEDGLSVADIARALGIDQKLLYRRRQRILAELRHGLEERGFQREDLAEIFHD